MSSDPVTTPPDTKPTMTSDPAAVPFPTTPITTSDTVTTPSDQASFASLPREIRDKIYRLALPHSCGVELVFIDPPPPPFGDYSILLPQASNSTYASEACAMLFKRNCVCIEDKDLQTILGEDGISYVYQEESWSDFVCVISKDRFDVKPWLQIIEIEVIMKKEMSELAGGVGLLLECSALRKITVILRGGRSLLRCAIGTISDAFKALAEKLGRRLTFILVVRIINDDGELDPDERLIGDLERLEAVAGRDEDSDSEYEHYD